MTATATAAGVKVGSWDAHTAVSRLRRALEGEGSPERAASEAAYLRSSRHHFGVNVPRCRALSRAWEQSLPDVDNTTLWDTLDLLWGDGSLEMSRCAVEIAIRRAAPTAESARRVDRWLREAETWALLDALAVDLLGRFLIADEHMIDPFLERWSTDDVFWVRRAALLAPIRQLRSGQPGFARFGRYADAQLDDREFFIRKAIGWVLREACKSMPDQVVDWVTPRVHRMSGLTFREATRRLPAADRDRLALLRQNPSPLH